jgi:hypothetical protein
VYGCGGWVEGVKSKKGGAKRRIEAHQGRTKRLEKGKISGDIVAHVPLLSL